MDFAIGVALFLLGLLISISLHEAGHLGTAKMFGMKATRYFVGFGPTVWSFRRGETEYGIKLLPIGGFVRIVGMTPQDDDVRPEDAHRAMWRFPVWKRTVVLGAGSAAHFVVGFVILWLVFGFVPLNDFDKLETAPPVVNTVSPCTVVEFELDPAGRLRECRPDDPPSAAVQAGLRPGDEITAFNGVPVAGWSDLTGRIRAAGGETVTLTVVRDGVSRDVTVTLPVAERVRQDVPPDTPLAEITDAHLERVGVLGITPQVPRTVYGPVTGTGMAFEQTAFLLRAVPEAIARVPERIPALWDAVFGGAERSPDTPVSIVGASVIGGDLWEQGEWSAWLVLLAAVNFFVGFFNLLPLLPLDGGHIAVAWFEKARSWVYARLGRPDPGMVDYQKLMPLTYVVILVLGGFFLLTLAADIVNPVRLT